MERAHEDKDVEYDVEEAAALLNHLVETEKLVLQGPQESLVEPIARLLQDVTPASIAQLETLLLDSDVVEELYLDAEELYDIVYRGHHLAP